MWNRTMRKRRGALHPGGGDEVALADRQRLGACEAGVGRPGGDRDGDDRVLDPRPQRRHEGQCQDQAREGQEHVGDAHQHGVEPAAGIARDRADEQADRADDHHDQGHDGERDPRAPDDPGVDVAAELVRAQPVRGRGRLQALGQVLGDRRLRREQGAKAATRISSRMMARPDQRHRVGAEGQPGGIGLAEPGLERRGRRVGEQPGAPARGDACGMDVLMRVPSGRTGGRAGRRAG